MLTFCHFLCFLTLTSAATANVKVERKLSKTGFHRDLETTIHLPRNLANECTNFSLLLLETLPAGVYADPFQIKSLEQFGGPQVYFVQSVNIEAAEFSSKPLELYTFIHISSFTHQFTKDVMESVIILPIHARYHQVATDPKITHAPVTILNPGLYTNCTIGSLSDTHTLPLPCDVLNSKRCIWSHVPYQSKLSQVMMKVPVGQAGHRPLVITATLVVSVVVSAVLAKIILSYQETNIDKTS